MTYSQILIFSVSVDKSGDSSPITKSERAIKVSTQSIERQFFFNNCMTKFNLWSSKIFLKF